MKNDIVAVHFNAHTGQAKKDVMMEYGYWIYQENV
jgi:hypothetical protein